MSIIAKVYLSILAKEVIFRNSTFLVRDLT